jgi:uncharacterized protein YjbJ (UPF0337 family)
MKKEMLEQKRLEAKLRAQQIQAKRRPLQESGYVQSQWGKATSPAKLIDNGHYMKSAALAAHHYKLERKRAQKQGEKCKVITVKKSA